MATRLVHRFAEPESCVMAGSLSVALATSIEELNSVTPMWVELLERGTIGQNVHNDPRMISLVLKQHRDIAPRVLLLSQGDKLVGVAPFYVRSSRVALEWSVWHLWPQSATVLKLFGESVILADDAPTELCVSAVGAFLRQSATVDFLQVYGLDYSDAFWQAALHHDALCRESTWRLFAMLAEKTHRAHLMESFDAYCRSLSTATRQGMRRARRRLFADSRARIETITEPEQVPRLLEWLDAVYVSSWQAKTFGPTRRNTPAEQALLEDLAAKGWLRSYVLLRNERPIAYQHGYLYDAKYYRLDCAFTQDSASAGPGSVLMFCLLEDLHNSHLASVVDFGFGDLPYKRSFGNVEHDAAVVYFVPANRWRRFFQMQTVMNSAYCSVRNGLVHFGADRLARKLIKRQK